MKKEKNTLKRSGILSWVFIFILSVLLFWQAIRMYQLLFRFQLVSGSRTEAGSNLSSPDKPILLPESLYVSGDTQNGRFARISSQNAHFLLLNDHAFHWLELCIAERSALAEVSMDEIPDRGISLQAVYRTELPVSLLLSETSCAGTSFCEIRAYPSDSAGRVSEIYLVDVQKDSALKITGNSMLWNAPETSQLLEEMNMAADRSEYHFYDGKRAYPSFFRQPVFLPDEESGIILYEWKTEAEHVTTDSSALETAAAFFEGEQPAAIQKIEDGWIFTDDKITLRVQRKGMIDYIQTPLEGSVLGLNEAYNVAVRFMEKDFTLTNPQISLVLTGVEQTAHGYRFAWDYRLGDYLFVDAEDPRPQIEIEIYNEIVYTYHRRLWKFTPNLFSILQSDDSVIQVMDRLGISECDELSLVYLYTGRRSRLNWFIRKDDVNVTEAVR